MASQQYVSTALGARDQSAPRLSLSRIQLAALGIGIAAVAWSLYQAGAFHRALINPGGWGMVWRFVQASVRPDLSWDMLALVGHSALVTISYAVAGATLSVLIGILGGIFSSETWWQLRAASAGHPVDSKHATFSWTVIRMAFAAPRSIHEIIWGLFFVNIFGLDPLAAILAIAIPYGAITSKVFAEIIDETPRQALYALYYSGSSPLRALIYGLLPSAFPYLLSYVMYRLECALRSAAVLGLIGAGGLGFQIMLSLQSLRYEQIWSLLYALILVIGAADGWSSLLNRRLNITIQGRQPVARKTESRSLTLPGRRDWTVTLSLIALVVLVPFSFWYLSRQTDFAKVVSPRTLHLFIGVMRDSFPPRLGLEQLGGLLRLSADTLSMSILAIMIAGVGGLIISFPAASNLALAGGVLSTEGHHPLRALLGIVGWAITRTILLVTRSLSDAIWVLLVLFVFFPGILPGAIGLGLYNLGVLGRLMAQVHENVDTRPLRALKAQGATSVQMFFYGLLPKVLPRCFAYTLYRWEECTRATVAVGIIGAAGLGRRLSDQLGSFDYRGVVATLIFYILIIFVVDLISSALRRTVR